MKVAVFSVKPYDRHFLEQANARYGHDLTFFEPRLTTESTPLAADFPAVCVFVNDRLDPDVLTRIASSGTKLVALRAAGFNNVDLRTASNLGLTVCRVPAYSPHAVAEHTIALIMTLNRKIHRAHARVREGNFALDGLLGFDLFGRTAGILGTGKIGQVVARILLGFGCRVLAHDPYPLEEMKALGIEYVSFQKLCSESDIMTLHTPLTPDTYHIIGSRTLDEMKDGVMLINTSRGALVDTVAVIAALKAGKVGSLGLDVYEEEAGLFFENLSDQLIQDDVFTRLLTFPNVVITGHQAFFTEDALRNIADTTLGNITAFETGAGTLHEVTP